MQEQALVDECGQRREDCLSIFARDRPSRFDRERAAERAEPVEQVPLGLVQEVVAPVDGRTHGLLARRRIAATGRGRVERRSEVVEEHTRGEHARPRGDELDGERQAVDTTADLVRGTDILLVPHDVGPDRADPLHEERHGVRERGDAVLVLALEPQRLATGREHLQVAGGFEQARDERGGREDVLEVVQDEQEPAPAETAGEARFRVRPGRGEPDRVGDRRRNELGVDKTVEGHVRDAVGVPRSESPRRLHGEAGLADPPRAGQRNEAGVARLHHPQERSQLVVPPDERGRSSGKPGSLLEVVDFACVPMEALGQEKREIIGHERPELGGGGEHAVRVAGLLFDSADELAQAVFASGRRLLDVEEHRLALREVELVLEARDRTSRHDPAVALPVHADEHIALFDVRRVQVARSVGTRTLLEEHRRQVQRRDGFARHRPLGCELAERGRDEHAQPAIRSQDRPPPTPPA